MPSSSSSDDVDERLDDIIDQIVEDTYNDIVEPQPNNRRRRAYVERYLEGGHSRLWNDYFSEDATYSAQFRRRFRMNKDLFMRIVYELSENIPFFQHRQDSTGRFGHTPLQKYTAAIRQLVYGSAADAVDEYLRIGESTALLCLHKFTDGISWLFGDEYLRRPTPADLRRLLDIGETRGVKYVVKGIRINWRTTSQTGYIQNGQHLSNLSHSPKLLNKSYLLKFKKQSVKMWSGLLEFYKPGLQL
ncbi:uncharacterized protein LOC125594677 [Brassica napus]|uniref:uncharacterized protein LOC125594677 n=1 Tax=Brassica napus TaxID=3708 RepID=UPI0020790AB5|nr:uncharacterized protein LOC125594677 [Brassica napus]